LEQRLVPVTPEYLGTVQLAEMRSQSVLLRRLGRHLHVTIPDTVEERLAAELLDAIAPMREGFARAAERIGQMDEALTARLLGGVSASSAINQAAGWGGALDQAALAPMLDELRLVREAVEVLPAALRRAAPEPARQPLAGGPGDLLLGKLIELLETSGAGIAALDASVDASLGQIREAYGALRAAEQSAGSPARGPAQLDAGVRRLAAVRGELDELGRAFREVAASSRTMLGGADGGGRSDPALTAELDRLGQHVVRFNERVRGFVRRLDEELARSSRLLNDAADRSMPKVGC
jgi:hypothetical protein